MNKNDQNIRQLREMLPFLKEAVQRQQPGAASKLVELSDRPDAVGVDALFLHGSILCDFSYPRFNADLGIDKLAVAAGRGSDDAVRLLLELAVRQDANCPRSQRKQYDSAVLKLKRWPFWLSLFEKRADLNDRTEKCLALARLLADRGGAAIVRQVVDFLADLESREPFRDDTFAIRGARAGLLCKHRLSERESIEGAKMLANMALAGYSEACKILLGFVQSGDRDNRAFVREAVRIADATCDGSLYFQLGQAAKSDSLLYYQKGALLGSNDCRLQILHLRLTHPQPDLPDARREIGELWDKPVEKSSKVLWASVLGLFVNRCLEAIEFDRRILNICQEARFRDNPAAKTATERFTRLSQWIEWAEKLNPSLLQQKRDEVPTGRLP